jgi:DNA-3-methyladenine glycosylase
MNHPDPLTGFFDAPADDVAPRLLGATLISRLGGRVTRGRIVEVEAYLGVGDPASHAFGGRRHRGNESLYRPPGTWYVYLSYGIHWCANLICGPEGSGGAVLLRALEPMGGFAAMRERRSGRAQAEWCSGPGKLCQAMGITRRLDGVAVAASRVSIELPPPTAPVSVAQGPRVGISKARDWPLRFWLEGTPWCSPG